MYIILDDRPIVTESYAASFKREGFCMVGVDPNEFNGWLAATSQGDIEAIDAFLLGECSEKETLPRRIRQKSGAPILCFNEGQSLMETLNLLSAGADDVLRKPIHPREIVARVSAINRRLRDASDKIVLDDLTVYFDGREPEIDGAPLQLPRRERRILEYLAQNRGRRVTKSQIFNAVYGLFDECVDENVIESHVCKLRKKLKHHLGFDPIESQRFLGYMFGPSQKPQELRQETSFEGFLLFDATRHKRMIACRILQLGATQARITLTKDMLLPVEPFILFENCNGQLFQCEIGWRNGNEVGLRLLGLVERDLYQELMSNAADRPVHRDATVDCALA